MDFNFLILRTLSVQDAFNAFIFFVLLDKILLEVTVANFRNIFHPITPQPGHVYLHVSLCWSSTRITVNSTSIGRDGPMRKFFHNSLLFSIFLKVDHTVRIASITLFEGHFSDPRSMICTSLYFESGGSSTCKSFSPVKKRRNSLHF